MSLQTHTPVDQDAIPTRVALQLCRVARPIGTTERVIVEEAREATDLLRVLDPETLGAQPEPSEGAPLLNALVPSDVLEELHDRGEIDLFDEQGNLIERRSAAPEEDGFEVLEELEPEPEFDPEQVIEALSKSRLFAPLDRATLAQLASTAHVRAISDRGYVFREGEAAPSFFVVIEGTLEMVRRSEGREIALRHLHRGEAFGLFGLFAGNQRAACVRAIGIALIAELPANALSTLLSANPASKAALARFYQERLLENFLGASPIFTDLGAVARGLLIAQFRDRKLTAGEAVVAPGQVFNGLFLVVSGQVVISRRAGAGREEALVALDRGQFFGVVAALSGTPCRVSIVATRDTVLAYLPQRAFNEFIKDYPTLRLLPQRLAQQGLLVEKDVFVGDAGIPGLS